MKSLEEIKDKLSNLEDKVNDLEIERLKPCADKEEIDEEIYCTKEIMKYLKWVIKE